METEYVRRQEAATFMGLSPSTLANWASARKGPTYHKVGRIPVYEVAELRRFMQANAVTPLS